MKFLKAVRLDDSDTSLFGREGAATEDEWVVSGGYAVAARSGNGPIALGQIDNAFIGVASHGRCTIAEVCEIDPESYRGLVDQLAQHFLADLGAPSPNAATEAAEEECAYTADLCESLIASVWITVRREQTAEGVGEHYSIYPRLMIGAHKL